MKYLLGLRKVTTTNHKSEKLMKIQKNGIIFLLLGTRHASMTLFFSYMIWLNLLELPLHMIMILKYHFVQES